MSGLSHGAGGGGNQPLFSAFAYLNNWLHQNNLPREGVRVYITFPKAFDAGMARAAMRGGVALAPNAGYYADIINGIEVHIEQDAPRPPPMSLREKIARKIDPQAFSAGWVTDRQKADALKRADEIVALLKAGEP